MTTWYIDAIDARAGLAIATRRAADLLRSDRLLESGPTVFVGPAAFAPEFAGTRGVGFALARSRAQLGVFHGKDELPFDSLTALAEFVRRSYLRGAAGDGTGESGGVAPPPSPQGGEPEPTPEGLRGIDVGSAPERRDPVAALLSVAHENALVSEKLAIGSSKPGHALATPTTHAGASSHAGSRRLVRGALRTLREVYRRRPNGHDSPATLHWQMTLHRLIAILTRMGLWPMMPTEFKTRAGAIAWIYGRDKSSADHVLDGLVHRMLMDSAPGHDPWTWQHIFPSALWSTTDPFEDLAFLPVPPYTVPFAKEDGQNLQSLLSAGVATPAELFGIDPRRAEECAELTLFGAASINLASDFPPAIWGKTDDACVHFAERLTIRAQAWLSENLPKHIYAADVEKMIGEASAIPA